MHSLYMQEESFMHTSMHTHTTKSTKVKARQIHSSAVYIDSFAWEHGREI